MIFFVSLCLEVGEDIEKARLSVDRKVSFSNRFKRDDVGHQFFSRDIGYPEFQTHCADLLSQYAYVVITDISDFYPRIYLHRIENALNSAARRLPTHAKAIIQLLKGWNQNVSHGIPIGNNQSRLIAEIAIDDIDRTMLDEGMVFARYVDDYRIFCRSHQEAHKWLARLANVLYESQGLTLQAQKTRIMSANEFKSEILETEERREVEALAKGFRGIISQLGLDNPSVPINYDMLPPNIQAQVDGAKSRRIVGVAATSRGSRSCYDEVLD